MQNEIKRLQRLVNVLVRANAGLAAKLDDVTEDLAFAKEPDMFWNAACVEQCEHSIHDVLVSADAEVGATVEIQRAVSLQNITVKVIGYDEDDNSFQYEVLP